MESPDRAVEELVDLALRGDRSAFGTLIRRHEGMVYSIAFSVCGNRSEAEDVAQEAVVAAYRSLRKLRDRARFSSWVAGIAYRKARAWRVRRSLRRAIWDRWFARTDEPRVEDPSEAARRQEDSARVLRAIAELPEVERLALVLRIQHGLHLPDIARILELTGEQARRAFERAVAALRFRLGGQNHGM